MTTDKSPNFADTKDFMMRRFSDAKVVGDAVGSVGQWVGFTASAAVNVLRSKGVRI
jgi:ubiquinone biosynthesis protein COQ9